VRPPLVASHASADGCAERRRRETVRCASCAGARRVLYDRWTVVLHAATGGRCVLHRAAAALLESEPHCWRCSVRDQTHTPQSKCAACDSPSGPPWAGGCRLHVVGCTLSAARCMLHIVGCCTRAVGAAACAHVPEGTRKINARARPPASTHGVWVHRVRRPCDRQVLDVQHTTAHVHRKACSLQRATRSRRHTCKTYQTTENMQHATRSTQHATCAERTVR
jgi:hypothetical protein